jgi:hypothetical protein
MKTKGQNFAIYAIQGGRDDAGCLEARAGGGGAHFAWWGGAAAGEAPAEAIPNPEFYFTRRCQVRGAERAGVAEGRADGNGATLFVRGLQVEPAPAAADWNGFVGWDFSQSLPFGTLLARAQGRRPGLRLCRLSGTWKLRGNNTRHGLAASLGRRCLGFWR